jgi:hypothetical protein
VAISATASSAAAIATNRTGGAQAHGASIATSLTSGYHLAFTISMVLVIAAIGLAGTLLRPRAQPTEEVVSLPDAIELGEAA